MASDTILAEIALKGVGYAQRSSGGEFASRQRVDQPAFFVLCNFATTQLASVAYLIRSGHSGMLPMTVRQPAPQAMPIAEPCAVKAAYMLATLKSVRDKARRLSGSLLSPPASDFWLKTAFRRYFSHQPACKSGNSDLLCYHCRKSRVGSSSWRRLSYVAFGNKSNHCEYNLFFFPRAAGRAVIQPERAGL
ncbi:hypothetical protein JHU04_001271 [Brenneria sp. 4F2]|nr:hypothetical protein [Brenneria bubanii]